MMFKSMLTLLCSFYDLNGRRMNCNDFVAVEKLWKAGYNSYLFHCLDLVIASAFTMEVSEWNMT